MNKKIHEQLIILIYLRYSAEMKFRQSFLLSANGEIVRVMQKQGWQRKQLQSFTEPGSV